LLNYTELCSTCQSYYKEVKRIISILSETYIIKIIKPFYQNPITELKKNPKVYFFDLGLRNYIIGNFNPLEKRTDVGAVIENFILLSLRNSFPSNTINYWRTIAKAEVDFILRLNEQIIPIEVKYQTYKQPKITKSLRSFIKTYKPKRAMVVTKDFWGEEKFEDTMVLFTPACYL